MNGTAEKAAFQPYLLIAMPSLADPNFKQAVTLIVEHNKDGALGLILNRPLTVTLQDSLTHLPPLPGLKRQQVHFGGPVELDRAWFLHGYSEISEEGLKIGSRLLLSSSVEVLRQVVECHALDPLFFFRFFIGYAGWGAGQLESEMAGSSWVTAPMDNAFLFSVPPEKMWEESIRRLGIEPGALAGGGDGQGLVQ